VADAKLQLDRVIDGGMQRLRLEPEIVRGKGRGQHQRGQPGEPMTRCRAGARCQDPAEVHSKDSFMGVGFLQ
jgi:hypothetical protein